MAIAPDKHERRLEPAILFRADESVCKSRLGGLPPLPDEIHWPVQSRTNIPFHFLGQIDLAALPRTPLPHSPDDAALPSYGMLYFFMHLGEGVDTDPTPEDSPLKHINYWKARSTVYYSNTAGADRELPTAVPPMMFSRLKCFPVIHPDVVETFWEEANSNLGEDRGRGGVAAGPVEALQMFGAPIVFRFEGQLARSEGRQLLMQFEHSSLGELFFQDCLIQFRDMSTDVKHCRFNRAWGTLDT